MTPAKPLTGDERRRVAVELSDRYADGATVRALAAETGRSYAVVHQLLREAGTTFRARGGDTTRKPPTT
ncbi:transcriptional regulator [Streptomyces sp. TRM72054]|uniref:helix-turn-helix domain-containing protein n=1 Tax=Streptomyces sp. TRM72054 TaxID=2870562 RepID=UPI001C8CD06F|nr:helix-turn-helix domain-containing protein [Streptomyces sp. TRM72054]MBX9392227.1 transcriptional regulator [Streptomyces sp. TRM72054]